ncbi:MAG: hypothetical protein JXR68_09925 [Bacteroidales bacterium]|nr:hypothetical protein [Bacteroidales bacterium]
MKKYVFIFLSMIFAACVTTEPTLKPPLMKIFPDTIVGISVISPVSFTINGSANEDIVNFSVTTTPFIDEFDTIFPSFTHSFSKQFVFALTDANMPDLDADSTITVIFEVNDSYNKTVVERYMKVYNGYPLYSVDSTELCYMYDSTFFYSLDYFSDFTFSQIQNFIFDMVVLYDNNLGFVIASPDAFYISQKLNELAYIYNSSNRRHTSFSKISIGFNAVTAKYLYFLSVSEQYINENGGNGVGVDHLEVGDVIAFKHNNGKKGAILITQADPVTKKLAFTFKFQD